MTVANLAVERPLAASRHLHGARSAAALVAVGAVMAPIGYASMLFGFHAYDDEGYMLLTLRDYLSGHPIVSQYLQLYGPLTYEVMGAVYRLLGLEPGQDNGRIVTLVVWLLTSLLGGVAGYRLTRNLWLGVGAQTVTFGLLTALASEPMTVYGLEALLMSGLVVAMTYRTERPRLSMGLVGAMVGALCMVKINVGVLAGIAVAYMWAACLPPPLRRIALAAATILVAAAPVVLMAGMLSQGWALDFALIVSISAVAISVAWLRAGPDLVQAPSAPWLLGGAAAVVVASIGVALVGGNRLGDMWTWLVLASIRFPGRFVMPPQIGVAIVVLAAGALGAAFALSGRHRALTMPAFGMIRVWAGFLIWLTLFRGSPLFLISLPLAWMATQVPRDAGDRATDPQSRLLLPMLAVMGSLQAYPVAGTQLALAGLALVPVGAIVLNDGIRQLQGARATAGAIRVGRAVAPSVTLLNLAAFLVFGVAAVAQFQNGTPLGLPGAQTLRLSNGQATTLRELTSAINRNCSSFITYPGMDSLYLWTGQTPPTPMRYGLWWLSLDDAQQQAIAGELQGRAGLCVVENQQINDFWAQGRPIPQRPLVVFIERNFVDAGSYGDYHLLVRAPQEPAST